MCDIGKTSIKWKESLTACVYGELFGCFSNFGLLDFSLKEGGAFDFQA
jgi:hypothetical protein